MESVQTAEIGAIREIGESVVLSALSYVKRGRALSLAQMYEIGMPTVWFHGPFFYSTYRTYQTTLKQFQSYENHPGALICRYELSDHTGTHVDSLNHTSINFQLYNGIDGREIQTDNGTTMLGIETMPPVVTRGVLLDFPDHFQTEMLESSYELTVRDIESLLGNQKMKIKPGDAILFYTGYSKKWVKDNAGYLSNGPGPGLEAAKWLIEKKISIAGADTFSFEVEPKNSKTLYPCHQYLIQKNGVHLIENMKLDELARERIYEFLFVCAPLRFKGGAGSPVAPIAVY